MCGGRLALLRAHKGNHVGPSPVNRGHPGSKHHLIVDANGILLAVALNAAAAPTSPSSSPCSTRSCRSAAYAVGPAANPASCSPTEAMTTTSTSAC